nr:three component ABC system middle component [Microvirga tunisiensis]
MSIDVFAETNPAFCSLAIRSFLQGYIESANIGAEFPTLFIVLPIAASEAQTPSFEATNKTTGLFTWLQRSPFVTLDLARRIDRTARFTRAAIHFGLQQRLIKIESGLFLPLDEGLLKKAPSSDAVGDVMKRSHRLGFWTGEIKSAPTVFNALGITI